MGSVNVGATGGGAKPGEPGKLAPYGLVSPGDARPVAPWAVTGIVAERCKCAYCAGGNPGLDMPGAGKPGLIGPGWTACDGGPGRPGAPGGAENVVCPYAGEKGAA